MIVYRDSILFTIYVRFITRDNNNHRIYTAFEWTSHIFLNSYREAHFSSSTYEETISNRIEKKCLPRNARNNII